MRTALILLWLFSASVTFGVSAATIVQYSFGPNGTTPAVVTPTATDPNATATSVTANTGVVMDLTNPATQPPTSPYVRVTFPAGNATPALAVTDGTYITFSVTPNAGSVLNCTSLTFLVERGGAGTPRGYVVRSSADSFAANLAQADVATVRPTMTPVTIDLSGASFQNLTTALTFRFYSYAPDGTSLDYDEIFLNGTVAPAAGSNNWSGATDSNWSTTTNWSLGTPVAGQFVVLKSGAGVNHDPTNLDISISLANVTFDSSTASPLTLSSSNGSTLTLTGSLSIDPAAANHQINFAILLGGGNVIFTVGGTKTLTLNGLIGGGGGLTSAGSGTLILGNAANSYTGVTTVGGTSTLSISTLASGGIPSSIGQAASGAGNLVIGPGTLLYNGSSVSIDRGFTAAGGTLNFLTAGTSISTTGQCLGSGGALVLGGNAVAGTLSLGGTTDNTGLGVNVSSGILLLAKAPSAAGVHAIGTTGLTIANGATVQLTGTGGDQISDNAAITINTGGTLDLNGNNESFATLGGTGGTVTNTSAATNSTLTLGTNNGTGMTWSGIIQNGPTATVALAKTGTGTQTLSGANTYSGGTSITAGILSVNTIADSGTSAIGPAASGLALKGGTLQYTGAAAATITTRSLAGSTGGSVDITNAAGSLTINTAVAFAAAGTLNKLSGGTLSLAGGAGTDNTNLILNAQGGTTTLAKSAAGVHAVAGISGISSGATVKITGTTGDQILGSGPTGAPGLVTVSAGTFDLNGNSESIDRLGGGGSITSSSAGTVTLTLGESGGSSGFGGSIVNGAGLVNVLKIGGGTQGFANFTATPNNYGSLTVNAGTISEPVAVGAPAQVILNTNAILDVGAASSSLTPAISGFTPGGTGTDWQLNTNTAGVPSISNNVLTLTNGAGGEGTTAFDKTTVKYDTGFTATFTYASNAGIADGVTFCLQNQAVTALGGSGGGQGYLGITKSAALQINIYAGAGGGPGIQFLTNGGGLGTNLVTTPVVLNGANPVTFTVSYYPSVQALKVDLAENNTTHTFSTVYTNVDLTASVTGTTCFVGFTGGTGGSVATQTISNFTYGPLAQASGAFNTNVTVAGTTSNPANIKVELPAAATSVALGSLSMSSGSQLNVTPGASTAAGQNYGVTFGATTLNGNATFSVAQNGAGNGVLTLGALNDGGVARTLNINTATTAGAVTLSAAAGSLVSGTVVNVVAGTLNSNAAGALGTNASVNLATATIFNLGASQTIAALNGSAGTVNTNGNVLTVGGNDNLNSTFGGVIADGSASGGIIKAGTGLLTLGGIESYTGPTTINAGTLTLSAGAGIAASAGSINNTNGVASPATAGTALRGKGTFGTVTTGDTSGNAVLWPGIAAAPSALTQNETLSGTSATLTNGGKLAIVVNQANFANQALALSGALTLDTTSTLSLACDPIAQTHDFTVVTTGSPITTIFHNLKGFNGGSGVHVVYQDSANPAGTGTVSDPTSDSQLVAGHTYNTIIISFDGFGVTPIKVDLFSAHTSGSGVLVEWNCVSEFQNAGFNIYRRAVGSDSWSAVNATLINGRITNADSKKYSLYDWAPQGQYEYRLESVSVLGERENYSSLAGPVALDNSALASEAMTEDSIAAAVQSIRSELSAQHAVQASLAFESGPAPRAGSSAVRQEAAPQPRAVSTLPTLTYNAQGTLVMPAAVNDLSVASANVSHIATRSASLPVALFGSIQPSAGVRWFTPSRPSGSGSFVAAKAVYDKPGVLAIKQNTLPAGFDIHHIAIQREGKTIPALAVSTDTLYVYALGYNDDYTDKDALFLRTISGPTAVSSPASATGLFAGTQPVNTSSTASVASSYHDVYFDFDPKYRPYTFTPWFSGQYLTSGSDQAFTLATPAATGGSALLTVNAWSLTADPNGASPDHALQVLINGQPVGQATWTGGNKMVQLSFDVPTNVLTSGSNSIDLVTPALPGIASQICFLHSMQIDYTKSLDGSQPLNIVNSGRQPQLYEIANLSSATGWIVDARFPDRTSLVSYEAQAQTDGSFKLRFMAAPGGTGNFQFTPVGSENQPLAVTTRIVAPVRGAISYLAVGPSQFSMGVQPLLALHSKQGIHGSFVDQEALFDYYGYGRYGPAPIQNAVRALKPKFLLLVGRTTYDYHNYSGMNVDPLCPAFLVSTSFWAQTTSDSLFGDLGRGTPEIAIGRLPVNDTTDLSGAVSHILHYKGFSTSGIIGQVTADTADPLGGDFPSQADGLIASNPEISWQRNYLGVNAATPADATASMTAAADGGANLLVYVGHGNAVGLGNESPHILDTDSVQKWTGNTVLLQCTCTANWMAKDVPNYHSVAIQALTQAQGGISASIGTSTYMNSDVAVAFAAQLLKNAAVPGTTWGKALLQTQQWALSQSGSTGFNADLGRTEQLFGDPAMPVFQSGTSGGSASQTSAAAGTF